MTQSWPDPPERRPVTIAAYAPPRRTGPTLWLVLGAVLLAAVVLVSVALRPAAPPQATPTPTARAPLATAGPGLPFAMPGDTQAQGRWEVLSIEWTPTGVALKVRLSCDARTISYGFIAFSNASTEMVEPVPSDRRPELTTGTLRTGESVTGWLWLPLPPGDATLILTTSGGHQVSALPIEG